MEKRISEAAIQKATIDHWRACGTPDSLLAAIPNQRAFGQAGLTPGLFDLLAIGGKVGVGFIELKADRGVVSEHQRGFERLLIANGVPHAITFGRDEPISVLEEWEIVRRTNRGPR